MYLGKCEEYNCYISVNASNDSVIITGKSGSGKSCKQNQLELCEAKKGNTVIVIDISRNHLVEGIFEDIRSDYCRYINRIDVVKDGLGMDFLKFIRNDQGKLEAYTNLINSIVQAFSIPLNMGANQKAILRDAIIEAVRIKKEKPDISEAEAITIPFMQHENNKDWRVVYQKLWTVLNCNVLRSSQKAIQNGAINIFDLSELDLLSSEIMAEIILSYLWRDIYNTSFSGKQEKITIALDEFQHCSVKKNSILRMMLREGRRFGLNLILTTQTLEIFSQEEKAMLCQAGTHLYFQPGESEVRKCARLIDPAETEQWRRKLLNLNRGECVAVGLFEVNGNLIKHPLKLK